VGYEYKRAGVTNVFMFAEPLANWRQVSVRKRKTKVDWALEMGAVLEGRYVECEKVIVVCDNLNTHTIGAFYEVFEPARARALVSRIEFHFTPKHGSWLNIAENELSCLTSQCVSGRRIGSEEELREETTAWYEEINSLQRGVEWQMKIDDARIKLKSIYPKIKLSQTTRSLSWNPLNRPIEPSWRVISTCWSWDGNLGSRFHVSRRMVH
jgi:hypothetical protein